MSFEETMKLKINLKLNKNIVILFLLLLATQIYPQFEAKWMNANALHNWYSSIGCEIEEGLEKVQQYGLRYPAIYQYQDNQAAKGLWIGATNFTDERGNFFPHKVVHVGPRVTGSNVFFPVKFELYSKFERPEVYVDGVLSFDRPIEVNGILDTLKADLYLYNKVNNQLGLTMERKQYQFSHPDHDNYLIYEYIFTNTGNVDGDNEIELPNNTLTDVYIFFQYRYSMTRQTRYIIGNQTGWGYNTVNDARGDGVKIDPPGENFRAQYAWHGRLPTFTLYDNQFAPIWDRLASPLQYWDPIDSVGRIGAPQFAGVVTIHADKSPTDNSDDVLQPKTTVYVGSDDALNSRNDPFNTTRMTSEYNLMSYGHSNPRHADVVQPDGNFSVPTGDPSLGTSGGHSFGNGYGPYTLAPGQSIKIVMAEVVASISREKAFEIGGAYKRFVQNAPDSDGPKYNVAQKNDSVFQGRKKLFQSFQKAIDNYNSGFSVGQALKPPKTININSGGDRIELSWTLYNEADPLINGFEVYRSAGRYDGKDSLIAVLPSSARSYTDTSLIRGVSYYYYVLATGNVGGNTVRSSRYYTQAYDPAFLKRQAGTSMDQIRVVPNPFSLGSNSESLRFPNEPNKLAFFNIPGQCNIKIYTELGELIYSMEHRDGSGDAYWNCQTSSNQIVVSGIYIAVIENIITGERSIVKFVVIR